MGRWCAVRNLGRGALMTLPQAWELSEKWYGDRLSAGFRRPTIDQAHAIFASVGLTGAFWRL